MLNALTMAKPGIYPDPPMFVTKKRRAINSETQLYTSAATKAICQSIGSITISLRANIAFECNKFCVVCQTWPSRLKYPTTQLATGPYFLASMKLQKYRPPDTGNADDNSLIANPIAKVMMLVSIQPQISTTGPPYSKPV